MYTEEAMEIIIRVYQINSIVTRDDYRGLDSRHYGRGLENEMSKRGYPEADYAEEYLDDYSDYSGVLYNKDVYTREQALQYLRDNVLKRH
ncbi:hypothetical protein [Enterocloster bolteae]|uniref:hypothetical protein n=1 Tax=Enterocloster bolteae TaxID=208479 RepID=UPI00210DB035|nr:hypothetical protein [Enterocloster bolteae]MCQ5143402.1 hypothetical protein [Enterocloster bolteae]